MQILPGEKYKKYIRFFAGLLMIMLAINPLLNLFQQDYIEEKIFDESFLQEQAREMDFNIEKMEEETNAYYEEILEKSLAQEMLE